MADPPPPLTRRLAQLLSGEEPPEGLGASPAELALSTAEGAEAGLTLLEEAMRAEAVVERATGVVMGRSGVCADQALDRLRSQAEQEGRTLHEVAADVVAPVEQAVPRPATTGAPPSTPGPLTALALVSGGLQPDDIPRVIAGEAVKLGLTDSVIYLSDLEQRFLVPLLAAGSDPVEPLSIDGTIAGRAYRTQRRVVLSDLAGGRDGHGGGTTVWLPLLDTSDRIGVLAASVDPALDVDDALLERLDALSNLTADILASKSRYGDAIIRTRRSSEVSLAAELRWAMLPPLTFTGRNLTIAGVVEPAYEISGDTFDYVVNGDQAHLAIIDAVGHGLEASRIANLAVVAYRHSRRRDLDPVGAYRVMDHVLSDQFGPEKFATAQLAVLDLPTGTLRWLNAGHPPPMIIRNGCRIDLVSETCLPVGLAESHGAADPELTETSLEPGDLVLFFTDGVTEARSADREEFGRDRLGDLTVRAAAAGQAPAETMRILGHAVLAHQLGLLQDDATLLSLTWQGPPR